MPTSNFQKHCVMTVVLPELKPSFDGKGVVVQPAMLATVAKKAAALSQYVHRHLRGSDVSTEIRFDEPAVVTINVYAAPMAAFHARHPNAFHAGLANFPSEFAQDRVAIATLATGETQDEANRFASSKNVAARAILRKILEQKDDEELHIQVGDEPPVNIQTSKPTSSTTLNKDIEEVTGSVRALDCQDNRVRLFKLGPRRPNLTLYVKLAEDRARLLEAELEGSQVTVKFRRLTNSMTSSRAPRHGVLVEIKDIQTPQ